MSILYTMALRETGHFPISLEIDGKLFTCQNNEMFSHLKGKKGEKMQIITRYPDGSEKYQITTILEEPYKNENNIWGIQLRFHPADMDK